MTSLRIGHEAQLVEPSNYSHPFLYFLATSQIWQLSEEEQTEQRALVQKALWQLLVITVDPLGIVMLRLDLTRPKEVEKELLRLMRLSTTIPSLFSFNLLLSELNDLGAAQPGEGETIH